MIDNKQVKEMADAIGMDVDNELVEEVLNTVNANDLPHHNITGTMPDKSSIAPKPFSPMSDEDIEEMGKIMTDSMTEGDEKYASLPSVSGGEMSEDQKASIEESKEEFAAKEMEATVVVDPVTGRPSLTEVNEKADKKDSPSVLDIAEGKTNVVSEIPDDAFDTLTQVSGMKEGSAIELIEFLKILREEGDQKDIFNRLPQEIKDTILKQIPVEQRTPDVKEVMAKSFIDFAKAELEIDEAYIDFQEAIQKELDIPDFLDLYLDNIKDTMEWKLLEKAQELEEEYPEHAERLRTVSKYFTYSYTLELLHREIDKKKKDRRGTINGLLSADLKKFTKHCNHFNREYVSSKFEINDIRALPMILERVLTVESGITADDIKKFVILFIRTTKGMQPTEKRVHEHAYMYYFVRNITMLDHIDERKTDFSKLIIENIEKCIIEMKNN